MGEKAQSAKARNDQVVRILLLLRDIDRVGGADLYELAERYGTSVRTIRRDLEALESAGFPLKPEPSPDSSRKRWSVDTAALRGLERALDASHYLALRLLMGQGGAVAKASGLYAALEDLGHRIESAVGDGGRKHLEAIDRCFFSWEKFAWRKAAPEVLWPLVGAISDERLCRLHYVAPHGEKDGKRFRALPLRLFVHQGATYLHAWSPRFKTVLTLNLQRLEGVEVLSQKVERPKEYRTEALEQTAFGVVVGPEEITYKLKFSKQVAPYIRERVWHPSQRLEELEGGGVGLTFRCPESFEVASWVAGWREQVATANSV